MASIVVNRGEAVVFLGVGAALAGFAAFTYESRGWFWPLIVVGALACLLAAWHTWRLTRFLDSKRGRAIAEARGMQWVRSGDTPEEIRHRKEVLDQELESSSLSGVGMSGATVLAGTQIDTLGNNAAFPDNFTTRNSADDTYSFVSDAYGSPLDR